MSETGIEGHGRQMTWRNGVKVLMILPLWFAILPIGCLVYVTSQVLESTLDGLANWAKK